MPPVIFELLNKQWIVIYDKLCINGQSYRTLDFNLSNLLSDLK